MSLRRVSSPGLWSCAPPCLRIGPAVLAMCRMSPILLSAALAGSLALAQAPPPAPDIAIPPEAAISAATSQLPLFYPGDWRYVHHYLLNDIHDQPAAFAVVFVSGAHPEVEASQAALEARVVAHQGRLRSLHDAMVRLRDAGSQPGADRDTQFAALRARLDAEREVLSGRDSFVTVYTGARSSLPVVRKCHAGLPGFLIGSEQARVHLNDRYPSHLILHPLFIDPFSITYEAVSEGGQLAPIVLDLESGRVAPKEELAASRTTYERQRLSGRTDAAAREDEASRSRNNRAWRRYLFAAEQTKQSIAPSKPSATTEGGNQ